MDKMNEPLLDLLSGEKLKTWEDLVMAQIIYHTYNKDITDQCDRDRTKKRLRSANE